MVEDRTGCELRRSPGLAVAPAHSNQGRCEAFPQRRPAMERLAAAACAYTESALQSRGGDGIFLSERTRFDGACTTSTSLQVEPLSGCQTSRARRSRQLWCEAR